ncbi:complement protein 1S [Anopheles sinensis]|uniref:Complement protein 1S n=1 Tax=Anopheles sinensis TaxID=74873 RepID=A0A084VBL9_ANOSI|nr:complement protein 1S [Anopheles sinensis]
MAPYRSLARPRSVVIMRHQRLTHRDGINDVRAGRPQTRVPSASAIDVRGRAETDPYICITFAFVTLRPVRYGPMLLPIERHPGGGGGPTKQGAAGAEGNYGNLWEIISFVNLFAKKGAYGGTGRSGQAV